MKLGAHYNSLYGGYEVNSYDSCFDSVDDQLSISRGYMYAKSHDYYGTLVPEKGPEDNEGGGE